MAIPIPESRNVSEIGAAERVSQGSALSTINAQEARDAPPQFVKLRYYIAQMQGLMLDTEA